MTSSVFQPNGSRRTAVRPSSLLRQTLTFLLCVALVQLPVTSALTAWISGPTKLYEFAFNTNIDVSGVSGNGRDVFTTLFVQDANAAISDAANSAGVTPVPTVDMSSVVLEAQTANPSVPYGVIVTFTVTNQGALSDAAILSALRASSLENWDSVLQALLGEGMKAKVLPVDGPSNAQPVVDRALIGVSGAAFLWYVVFDVAQSAIQDTSLLLALLVGDLQNILDPAFNEYLVDVPDYITNASGYYGVYSVYRMDTASAQDAMTPAEIDAALIDKDLPFYTSRARLIFDDPDFSKFSSLLPQMLTTTRHMLPAPENDDDDGAGIAPVVETVTSESFLYFSGTTDGWQNAAGTLKDAFNAAVVAALEPEFARTDFVNTVTVTNSYTRREADDRVEGLYVQVKVLQGVTALSKHTYNDAEVSSIMANAEGLTPVLAFYTAAPQAADATLSGVAAPSLVAAGPVGDYGLQCTPGCVGMIIMSAIAVFLMLLIIVICVIVVCCCYMGDAEESQKPSSTRSVPSTAQVAPRSVAVPVRDTPGDYTRHNRIDDSQGGQQPGYPAKASAAALNPLTAAPGTAGGGAAVDTSLDEMDSFSYIPRSRRSSVYGGSPQPATSQSPSSGFGGGQYDKAAKPNHGAAGPVTGKVMAQPLYSPQSNSGAAAGAPNDIPPYRPPSYSD